MKRFSTLFKKGADSKTQWKQSQSEVNRNSGNFGGSSNNNNSSSSGGGTPSRTPSKKSKLPPEEVINMKFEKLLVSVLF
jgi:hypothetical protein